MTVTATISMPAQVVRRPLFERWAAVHGEDGSMRRFEIVMVVLSCVIAFAWFAVGMAVIIYCIVKG